MTLGRKGGVRREMLQQWTSGGQDSVASPSSPVLHRTPLSSATRYPFHDDGIERKLPVPPDLVQQFQQN
jgi:hypothetical protein